MIAAWKSLLFVPADAEARIRKAHLRGAHAIILDLEDAVSPAAKPGARASLASSIAHFTEHGTAVLVRINAGWREAFADMDAAVIPGVSALLVPKVEDPHRLGVLSQIIAEFECERGMKRGGLKLLALIEHPAALPLLNDIASVPRVAGLALGSEDFALAAGAPPSPALLRPAAQAIAFAAAKRGQAAIGLPMSLAEYGDLARYAEAAAEARAMGLTGALCIHPAQIAVINAAFAPGVQDIEDARQIVAAWGADSRGGAGAIAVNGRMVDLPVVERARRLLSTTTQYHS